MANENVPSVGRERPEADYDLIREAYKYNQQIDVMRELRKKEKDSRAFSSISSWVGMGFLGIFTAGGLLLEGLTGNQNPWREIAYGGLFGYGMGMLGVVISLEHARITRDKIRKLEVS